MSFEHATPGRPDPSDACHEDDGTTPGFGDKGGHNDDRQANERFNHRSSPQNDVHVLWLGSATESSRTCESGYGPCQAIQLAHILSR